MLLLTPINVHRCCHSVFHYCSMVTLIRVLVMLCDYESANEKRTCDPNISMFVHRWQRLLQNNDDAQIWLAINWRSEVSHGPFHATSSPTDQQAGIHKRPPKNPFT